MTIQVFLTATVMNAKRLAAFGHGFIEIVMCGASDACTTRSVRAVKLGDNIIRRTA